MNILPLIIFVITLVFLGGMARKRRQTAALGDMFLPALKDKTYRFLIAAMVFLLLLAISYLFML